MGIGSLRTVLDLEDSSTTKNRDFGLRFGIEKVWRLPWPRRFGLGIDVMESIACNECALCNAFMVSV